MRRAAMVIGTALLLCCASGCGGLNDDEKKAAKSIATSFSGKDASKARQDVGSCFGDTMVKDAGLDQLKKDKVIDKNLKATATVPRTLSKKTAEAYGDGIVKCFDFTKLKKDIKQQTGADTKSVNAYVTCLDKISDDDLKQAIVDEYTKKKATKVTKRVNAATQACGKKLGT